MPCRAPSCSAPAQAIEHAPERCSARAGGGWDTTGGAPTLFCVFTTFADRTPLVGFHFRFAGGRSPPADALVFRREQDGSQAAFGGQGVPSPEWAFDGTEDPAVIRAPEDGMQINLSGYEPEPRGTRWFEAGLPGVRDKTLGNRCRFSA